MFKSSTSDDNLPNSPAESDDVAVFEDTHIRNSFFSADPRFMAKLASKPVKAQETKEPKFAIVNKPIGNKLSNPANSRISMDSSVFGDWDLKKYFGAVDPRASFLAGVAPLPSMSEEEIMRQHANPTGIGLSPIEPSPIVESQNTTPIDSRTGVSRVINNADRFVDNSSKSILSNEVVKSMADMEKELSSDSLVPPGYNMGYPPNQMYPYNSYYNPVGQGVLTTSGAKPEYSSTIPVTAAIDSVGMSGNRTAYSVIMDADGKNLLAANRARMNESTAKESNSAIQGAETAQPQQSSSILLSCFMNKMNRHGGFQKRLFRCDGLSLMCFSSTTFDLPEGHNIVSIETKEILKMLHAFVDKPTKLAIGKCYLKDLPLARYIFNPMLAECSTKTNSNPNIRGIQLFLPKYVIPLTAIKSVKFPDAKAKRKAKYEIVIQAAKQGYVIRALDETWLLRWAFILTRIATVLKVNIENPISKINLLLEKFPLPEITDSFSARQAVSKCWKETMEALIESDVKVKSHIVTIKSIRSKNGNSTKSSENKA